MGPLTLLLSMGLSTLASAHSQELYQRYNMLAVCPTDGKREIPLGTSSGIFELKVRSTQKRASSFLTHTAFFRWPRAASVAASSTATWNWRRPPRPTDSTSSSRRWTSWAMKRPATEDALSEAQSAALVR